MRNILLLISCLFSFACNQKIVKNNASEESLIIQEELTSLVGQVWYVNQFPTVANKAFRTPKQYKMTFEDKAFGLELDANNCGGSYSISGNKITFGAAFCTEMCCDSKEGQELSRLLSGTLTYGIDSKTKELVFKTPKGDILLKKELATSNKLWNNRWKAISWADGEKGEHKKFEKAYFLNFQPKKLLLELDVNNCNTTCKYEGIDVLELAPMGCTRKCCDSKEGLRLMEVLQGKVSYKLKKSNLYLTTMGIEIILSPTKKGEE